MKLFGSTKKEVSRYENGDNVPRLEITEVPLTHCNFVNSNYQQDSRVLYTFVPDKLCGQLLDISPKSFVLGKLLIKNFNI